MKEEVPDQRPIELLDGDLPLLAVIAQLCSFSTYIYCSSKRA